MLRLFDLFCCEGGASQGYSQAGFQVYGLDLFEDYTRKRYPFPAHKGDAIAAMDKLLTGGTLEFDNGEVLGLSDFAVLTASPPCQHASAATRAIDRSNYPRLIPPIRDAFIASGKFYIIENVRGADLIQPTELCGCMFNMTAVDTDGITLHLQRPRRFESNVTLVPPKRCDHSDHEWVGGSYGGARRDKYEAKYVRKGGYVPAKKVQQELLGIDWMTERGMHQAIPPKYTQWLGWQLRFPLARRELWHTS